MHKIKVFVKTDTLFYDNFVALIYSISGNQKHILKFDSVWFVSEITELKKHFWFEEKSVLIFYKIKTIIFFLYLL